jgi:hypothetical protein
MKIKICIMIVVALAISLTVVSAQPSEGGGSSTNEVPLNYNELLLGAGVMLGIVKVMKSKSKKNTRP